MREVENKWDTLKLNDDIWAKLIYFEQNRRLAKAYVSAPVLTVDGTTSGLDGFRIGLSGIDNTYRSLESFGCLRSIGLGIKLKIDTEGNILMRKIGHPNGGAMSKNHCSIWLKDWPPQCVGLNNPQRTIANIDNHSLDENCMIRHIEQCDVSYKLFDMRKFRAQLERSKANNTETALDWRQCVSIISFVQAEDDATVGQCSNSILDNPCWLMIINIIAIDMLKSSICDKPAGLGSSSLIHNHSLLEARSRPLGRQNIPSPRAKSSVSIPLKVSSLNNTDRISISESTTGNSGAIYQDNSTEDRVKKLRTTNNRYRPTPISRGGIRRYQSTQQLNSENSTIYTTFNGKYCNSRSLADNSSTSDYNSASRATSSGQRYWRNHQPYYPMMDPIHQRTRGNDSNYYRTKRVYSTPKSNIFDTNNKSLSLSSFDLSSGRLDLKFIPSSIKMNFDYLSEAEDGQASNTVEIEKSGKSMHKSSTEQSLTSMPRRNMLSPSKMLNSKTVLNQPSVCCELTDRLKSRPPKNHHHVNHHDCQAMHGSYRVSSTDEGICTNEGGQQKVSKSSIASSSSSSGCPDNEYFMTQSSSSMTSSSASHERDPFSQPASSSGIAGSGNTSDEYEDGRKVNPDKGKDGDASPTPKPEHVKVAEMAKVEHKCNSSEMKLKKPPAAKITRRGKIKTIKTSGFCDCVADEVQHHEDHMDNRRSQSPCDCPSIEYGCNCCCDCYSSPLNDNTIPKSEPLCDCKDESIYGRTGRLVTPVASSKTSSRRSGTPGELKIRRNGSKLNLKVDENILIVPVERDDPPIKPSKELKSSGSWLERHKYSRILPRFIFSSHGNGGHV